MTKQKRVKPTAQRFWTNVVIQPDKCWVWIGKVNRAGTVVTSLPKNVYGESSVSGARAALYWDTGRLGSNAVRTCPTRMCVNPEHYEWRTDRIDRICIVDGCTKPMHAHGMCSTHDRQTAKYGETREYTPPRPATRERFWSEVDCATGINECWNWLGPTNDYGYGTTSLPKQVHGGAVGAHRAAWYWTHGELPAQGLHVDHLCSNVICVNPKHLEVVTPWENTMRSTAVSTLLSLRDACDKGHPFEGDNLAIRKDGTRKCRQCHREYMREYRRRDKLGEVA